MHEYYLAYRHANGEVEGFKGVGFDRDAASRDAISQVRKKLANMWAADMDEFDAASVIYEPEQLSPEELNLVIRDWTTNLRY